MDFLGQLKNLSKDALIYGLGNAISRLIGIITAPILTHLFAPADYGAITLVQTCISFLTMFAGLNLVSGVFYYYFKVGDIQEKQLLLSTALIFFVVVGAVISYLTWLFAPSIGTLIQTRVDGEIVKSYDYTHFIRLLSIWMFFSLIDTHFRSILRLRRQPVGFIGLSVLYVLLNLGCVLLLVIYFDSGIEGVLWAQIVAIAITSAVGLYMVSEMFLFTFSWEKLGLFMSYSLPQFPSVLINLALIQLNVFCLNYYTNEIELGLYSTAFKVASIILVFVTAFRMAWSPMALSIMGKDGSKGIYSRIYTFFVVWMGLLGCLIALFSKPLLILITPVAYHSSYPLVAIIIYAFLYQGASNILGIGINISAKTKFISYAQGFTFIVNITLNVTLIPALGALGAAIAFAAAIFTQSLAYYLFAQKLYPIAYGFWRMHIFTLVLIGLVWIEIVIVSSHTFAVSLVTGGVFFILCSITAWYLGFQRGEREEIMGIVSPYLTK